MRLTLWGIFQYDPTLFDGFSLPEGLDKSFLIDEIMRRSGDLFTYYQVPGMLKQNITNWFLRNYDQFSRMAAAITAEYNPIENYDRTEESTHTPAEVITTTRGGSDTRTLNTTHGGTDSRSITTKLGSTSTTTNERSAYDATGYSPNDKSTTGTSGGDSSTDTFKHGETENATDTYTRNSTDTITNSGTHDFKSHIHGNIGVTTNAKMVSEEVELRRFDIYTDIARRFEREFLINIY